MRVVAHGRFEILNTREINGEDLSTITLLLDFETDRAPLTTKVEMVGHLSATVYRGSIGNRCLIQWDTFLEYWIEENLGPIVDRKASWPDGGEPNNRTWVVECDEHCLLTHEDRLVREGARLQIMHLNTIQASSDRLKE